MKKYKIIFSSVVLIVLDQVIKLWMIKFHPFIVIHNDGVIFGFIQNQVIGYVLLVIGFGILIWLICQTRLSLIAYRLSLILILAGAISNLIDRISHGYVVDYISFFNLNHFNLADIFIIGGVLIFFVQTLKSKN